MNIKNWKLGFFIATMIGVFSACGAAAVLDVVINWKFIFFFIATIGKDVVLFLVNHPADKVSFDTQTIKRTEPDGTTTEQTHRQAVVTPQNPVAPSDK